MMLYTFRAADGETFEVQRPRERAPINGAVRFRGGKRFVHTRIDRFPGCIVENIHVVSMSMPFLSDAQLADPSVPKAANYTKDPITGLNHATFRSKRERREAAARTGYVVDD